MKYAVFADVHGNQYALRQLIADTRGQVQGYWYLGDTCGYYYGQTDCMEQLRQLPNAVLLCGNHDRYYLDSREDAERKTALEAKYGSSYLEDCGPAFAKWLNGLRPQAELTVEGIRAGLFHGCPADAENGRIYPDSALEAEAYQPYDVVFQGHTHYRMLRHAGNTLVVNPGSLGQPRDGKGFSYGVFDAGTGEFTFRVIHFEKAMLLQEIDRHPESEKNAAYLKSVLSRGDN